MRPYVIVLTSAMAVLAVRPGPAAAASSTSPSRPASASAPRTSTVVQAGDARVGYDDQGGAWVIEAGGAALSVVAAAGREFSVARLTSPSGANWIASAGPDNAVVIDGTPQTISPKSGFAFAAAATSSTPTTVQLDVAFDNEDDGMRVTRHYRAATGSPAFETWSSYSSLGSTPRLSDLNAAQLTIAPGQIRWLSGLQANPDDTDHQNAFTLSQQTLAPGEHLALSAVTRSSERAVPWFAVDGAQDEFFAALMWSGAWSLDLGRTSSALTVSFGLASMITRVTDQPIDGPHVVYGVVKGGLPDASAALQAYVLTGLRGGRPISPLVTYNTWFAYGTDIDEANMRDEMTHAAALGAELFVIDAGWYAGAGTNGVSDFDSGLGTWQVDTVRFPNGLQPLSDYAHSLGMKFGLWVEPERLDLAAVGENGLDESWLATNDGSYGSDHAAQICFAGTAARAWVLAQLQDLIDTVHPDYLKWDNNMFVNCTRGGHGHVATDGNFAHVNGLYSVLAQLRAQNPDLLIENVSGGGNRLDLAMLQYTDAAWMDDHTAPSLHVRHNVEGLSAVFAPGYLLSFLTDESDEPLHDAADMPLYIRSRMEGALGLCFRDEDLSNADTASIATQVQLYKSLRDTLGGASASLLTPQAGTDPASGWDALQQTGAPGQPMLIGAFQTDDGTDSVVVHPTHLDADVSYDVSSVDGGDLGTLSGADLMQDGIEVAPAPNSASHLLILTPQP